MYVLFIQYCNIFNPQYACYNTAQNTDKNKKLTQHV